MISFDDVPETDGLSVQGIQHHLVMGTVNVAMNGPRKSSWNRLAKKSLVYIPVSMLSQFLNCHYNNIFITVLNSSHFKNYISSVLQQYNKKK